MNLADKINRNTQYVLDGKTDLANAITAKGGEVGAYVVCPSFTNLIDGVNSIMSVNDLGKEKIAVATENIAKGEICSFITPPAGALETTQTRTFPTSAVRGTKTATLTGEPIKLDNEGKLILMQDSSSSGSNYYYYAFCWNNNEYVQMMFNGAYGRVGAYATNGASTCYDEVTNNLFWTMSGKVYVFKIDFENLNITQIFAGSGSTLATGHITGSSSSNQATGCHVACNNHFIARMSSPGTNNKQYMYKYNEDTNTITYIGELFEMMSAGSVYSAHVRSFTVIGDNLYILVWYRKQSSTAYGALRLIKFVYSSSTNQYAYSSNITINNVPTSDQHYTNQMNQDASLILYINYTDNSLHGAKINRSTMAYADMTFTFSDGETSIDKLVMVRNTKFIYVHTTSGTVKLYQYDENTGVCNFVCSPSETFNPATLSSAVPSQYNLIDGAYTIYQKTDNSYAMYKVEFATREYDVIATPCNNMLVDGATGYGIAKEDIAMGAMGSAIVILEA